MSYVREPEVVKTEKTVNPVQKIFIDSEDKNVAVYKIYTKDGSNFTYDEEGKKKVEAADMFNLFVKGVVAVKEDVFYKPVSCTKAGVINFGITSTGREASSEEGTV